MVSRSWFRTQTGSGTLLFLTESSFWFFVSNVFIYFTSVNIHARVVQSNNQIETKVKYMEVIKVELIG